VSSATNVVGLAVNHEGAVGDAVGNTADCGSEVRVLGIGAVPFASAAWKSGCR
jgi:hypothetical protein